MLTLTKAGEEKINNYLADLAAKRKEILDAGKDTADYTDLPDVYVILDDIAFFENGEEYINGWGCTDNYDSDYPLHLENGIDYRREKS